jgi:hypothetical protein
MPANNPHPKQSPQTTPTTDGKTLSKIVNSFRDDMVFTTIILKGDAATLPEEDLVTFLLDHYSYEDAQTDYIFNSYELTASPHKGKYVHFDTYFDEPPSTVGTTKITVVDTPY